MPKKNFMATVGQYMSLAFLLPAATFVGYLIGYLLDKLFGTHFLYIAFPDPRHRLRLRATHPPGHAGYAR